GVNSGRGGEAPSVESLRPGGPKGAGRRRVFRGAGGALRGDRESPRAVGPVAMTCGNAGERLGAQRVVLSAAGGTSWAGRSAADCQAPRSGRTSNSWEKVARRVNIAQLRVE